MPETAILSDPKGRLRIEYSRPAMQKIRDRAIDGLMALPRIGMGVGGLLLGIRRDGVISLVNSIEIPCSHALGPSFNLTEGEKQYVAELIAGAGHPGVIGWYCSKTRGAPMLDDSEVAIFRQSFPGPDHLALVIWPSTVMPVRAAFYVRDKGGRILREIECDLDEWNPGAGEEQGENQREDPVTEVPIVVPETRVAAPPPPPPAPDIVRPSPVPIVPDTPVPQIQKRKPRLSGWMFAGAACVALAALSFFTRNIWRPASPLSLTLTQSDGKLMIRWNTDALRGMDHASLTINDGGSLQSLSLQRVQLNQGVYIYSPKSQRVTARMSVGDRSAIAVWFAPALTEPPPAQPAAAPVTPQKSPSKRPARPPVPDDR